MSFAFRNILAASVILVCLVGMIGLFVYALLPADSGGINSAPSIVFQVKSGDGFRDVAKHLYNEHLIRSPLAFDVVSLLDGAAPHFKPGLYRLSSSMSAFAIMQSITDNGHEVSVTIPEGSTLYDVDRILSNALVIRRGDLIAVAVGTTSSTSLEGTLFPDTYKFFTDSDVNAVIKKMVNNFTAKAGPLLATSKNATQDLIVASLVEKEVASSTDQAIVAGIIKKRFATGMTLNIDATICYAKLIQAQQTGASSAGCYPLTIGDLKIDSPYNTYTMQGLPPTPISNPGVAAIEATLNPKASPYLYYLSDPKTGKTIYAKTLEEQNANIARYLR
jgi:UPF0755 protein